MSLSAPAAVAVEVGALEVTVSEGEYRVALDAVIHAPVEAVSRVLTDYLGYSSLDPRIRASEILGADERGGQLVRTLILACAGVFCRSVRRVERVRIDGARIVAEALPERSDVRYSRAETVWRADSDRTVVSYRAAFSPDFWVPSWVERRYAPAMLRESVLTLFGNVEERALGR